ncbi:MAG: HlyD family efflux transporter periplasmic adaptor subunit [Eubacteriales bacterium]|nr:HlyD family efflux transporter periplasmic adaptor subunit [Eubacteriales bacterium]MDD3198924.1 HlyD family efflux transporter periplasmic adaptor subunit [Eubacteriales bacterium]MDD4122316.1 HlyD family efflux transporter periplasmic adaptor subunit [Eubacteriales bacterium]MDD4629589.1 HlyD family efflux transporter periplasmic adaptor subunit [Eubacteriales bacterium]
MKWKKKLVLLFCTTLIILFIIIYVFPNVTGALKQTEIIEYGSLQETDRVTAFFVRSEIVYFANKPGTIQYYVKEGEQVRKGIKVLDISHGAQEDKESSYKRIMERISRFNGGESIFSDDIKKIRMQIIKLEKERGIALGEGETKLAANLDEQIKRLNQKKEYIEATDETAKEELVRQNRTVNGAGIIPENYISDANGVVSYYIDGYESEFTPENMELLSREKIKNMSFDVQSLARDTTLTKEPLYKVVDNKKWYAVFWVAPEHIVKYEKGKLAKINLPLGQVDGRIYNIIDDKGEWLVILEFNRYYEEFAQIREIEAEVVTSDYMGLTIRNENITSKDGQPGVFVKAKSGEYVFKPIEIITSDGEWSLVEASFYYTDDGATKVETVNIYDEILKKPN